MDTASDYRSRLSLFADALRRLRGHLESTERADAKLLEALSELYLEGQRLLELEGHFDRELDLDEFELEGERARLRPLVEAVAGPVKYYSGFFSPVADLAEDNGPVVGDLHDDLLDLCGDLLPGLRAFDSGRDELLGACHFAWRPEVGFWHWGQHAIGAMTALHGQLHVSTPSPQE